MITITKEEIYNAHKTISRVSNIEDEFFTQKKITLRPEEAKLLLSRGVTVYKEEITPTNGTKFSRLFCYVALENLIKAAK